jgi:phenylpropionate dioxygenase-like ring-hydroxylating dioxygenase large terminal subunit
VIRNQWYVVLESDEIGRRPVGVRRMGEDLVFWRDSSGNLQCFQDRCIHRGVRLSGGQTMGDHLQCPFHGFEYDGSGQVQRIPANGRAAEVPKAFKVAAYPIHEAQGFVWIWWAEPGKEPPGPPEFFRDLGPGLSYASARDPWRTHYSRVIENQLDVVHLPFIHHNTIGRGGRTVVDGPGFAWVGPSAFEVYPSNRVDDGRPPIRPSEFQRPPNEVFKLEFIFPNLWQNYIDKRMRIVAAFVPVAEDSTILYLRFYQGLVRLPVVRGLVNRLGMPFNLYIAHQDRRVVETHSPKASRLRSGEQLIHGDHPIVEYRRRRAELMQEAAGEAADA